MFPCWSCLCHGNNLWDIKSKLYLSCIRFPLPGNKWGRSNRLHANPNKKGNPFDSSGPPHATFAIPWLISSINHHHLLLLLMNYNVNRAGGVIVHPKRDNQIVIHHQQPLDLSLPCPTTTGSHQLQVHLNNKCTSSAYVDHFHLITSLITIVSFWISCV